MKLHFVFLLAILLVSCAPQTDLQGLKGRIAEYNKLAEEAMVAGQSDTTLSYYDDNAISLPSNSPMLQGKEAIGRWMKDMSAMGVTFSKVDFNEVHVDASGSLGYEVGTYDMTMEIGGMQVSDKGKYITVWKRHADGTWKLVAEIWNTDLPAPEPSAESKK